jgi:hypothetical protein
LQHKLPGQDLAPAAAPRPSAVRKIWMNPAHLLARRRHAHELAVVGAAEPVVRDVTLEQALERYERKRNLAIVAQVHDRFAALRETPV